MASAMTSSEFGACVHPREMPRFLLALLFVVPVSLVLLLVTLATNGALVGAVLLLAFLVWLGFEISYALLIGNWILVSEHNYPRVNELLKEVKETIGVPNRIDIIVFQRGEFNALFRMLFARRAIFMNSEMLSDGVSDDEIRWLIGRFVGRIRAKRRMGPLRYLVSIVEQLLIFNLFIFPYERATAYTGDRVGLAAIKGDISAATSAMNKLMVGRELGYSVNPAGVMRQYRRVKGSLFGFLARLGDPLPHMLARYVDLVAFSEKKYPNEYQQFAAMNPSLQVAGGAWKLVRSTKKEGDNYPNLVGVGLLGGGLGLAAAGLVTITMIGPGFGLMGAASPFLASLFNSPAPAPYAYGDPAYLDPAAPLPADPGAAIADPAALDDADFQQAQITHTEQAYQDYLFYYPAGRHRAEAETAIAALREADISGAWSFATADFTCGADKCYIQGSMQIFRDPSTGGYTCSFLATQIYPASQSNAQETCTIAESADGSLTLNSTVVSSSSTGYSPDNFVLRRESGKLVGDIALAGGTSTAYAEFTRAQ